MHKGRCAQAELTFDPDGVPVSHCQKCRRPGNIAHSERKRLGEEYTFVCSRCRHRWLVEL